MLSQDQFYKANLALLESIGTAVAVKEAGSGVHNYRVTWIAIRIAEEMKLSVNDVQELIVGSLLHDVGNLFLSDAILNKAGKLTAEEIEEMQLHVEFAEKIVAELPWLGMGALSVVRQHHERLDGSGYPKKLAGNEISQLARIFAVADVFDALATSRVYKIMFEYDAIMDYLQEQSGCQFDETVVEAFSVIAGECFNLITQCDEKGMKSALHSSMDRYFP